MSRYGFSYVPAAGIAGFRSRLQEGAWGAIDITALSLRADEPIPEALLAVPRQPGWKALLSWSVSRVETALFQNETLSPSTLDQRWDAAQRQLRNTIVSLRDDEDPEIRAAAERAQRLLLRGDGGLAQTKLTYRQEADFGEMQVSLSRQEPLQIDVSKLGIERFIARIERETQALRESVGTTAQAAGLLTERNEKLRQALRDASNGFSRVLGDIDWLLEYLAPSASHELLRQLREPLHELLLRYPGPAVAPEPIPSEALPAPSKP